MHTKALSDPAVRTTLLPGVCTVIFGGVLCTIILVFTATLSQKLSNASALQVQFSPALMPFTVDDAMHRVALLHTTELLRDTLRTLSRNQVKLTTVVVKSSVTLTLQLSVSLRRGASGVIFI